MEELELATIAKRSIHGVLALVSRTFLIQLIGQIAAFLLTIYLSPEEYGVFFIVSSAIVFLSYFSDIGLAAALIQKKEPLTNEDLKTTFTIQQVLVIGLSVLAFAGSSGVAQFYSLDQEGVFLFQALIIAFFLSSLKTIPSILLERQLQFQKLVIPEIVETVLFNIVILLCAINGYGVTSFTMAVLARGIGGVVIMHLIAPWKMGFGFSTDVARRLLSFGIPFQANSLLALLKDNLLIIYIGKVLPLSQVGYIGVAQKLAYTPLRLVMENIIKITFPSYARLAHDKEHLGLAIEKSLFVTALLVFPGVFGMLILFPYFIDVFPLFQKWEPAFISLVFFGINSMLSSVSTPLTNALNAIGKISVTLSLMIFWTFVTWVITPVCILWFGFNGVSFAASFIACSVILVLWVTRRYIVFNPIKAVASPVVASFGMAVVLYGISPFLIHNFITFLCAVIIGMGVYFAFVYFLAKREILQDVQYIRKISGK